MARKLTSLVLFSGILVFGLGGRVRAADPTRLLIPSDALERQVAPRKSQPSDRLETLERRLEQMERRHSAEVKRLQAQLEEIQQRTTSAHPTHREAAGQIRRFPRTTDGLVARLPHQAGDGTQVSLINNQDQPTIEENIESLLQQGEARRAEAPPELGAGLGARLSAYNPNISLIGDFLGVVSSAPEPPRDTSIPLGFLDEPDVDQFTFREIELMATAAVDPYSDGLVKLAFAPDGVDIEEAFVLFHDYPFRDKLPKWLQDVHTKVGVFRMSFGPLNLVDEHDLPTVDSPLVLQRFLGEEGLIRAGVSLSKVLRQRGPWVRKLDVEITSGDPLGDEAGSRPFAGVQHPLGLVHYSKFRSIEPAADWESRRQLGCQPRLCDGRRTLEWGTTFAATGTRIEATGEDLYSLVEGLNLTWQWYDPRPDSYRQYLLQAEAIGSQLDQAGGGVRGDAGGYVLGQVRLNREWFAGLRFDLTEFPDRNGFQLAGTPFVTYFISEFNRVRFQYQYLRQQVHGPESAEAHTFWVQLVFAYGAHPPEPYYLGQRF